MSLRQMRRSKGWSQEQLADLSGVSIRTIQRLESGETAGLETQKALAAAFAFSLEDLNARLGAPEVDDTERTENQETDSFTRAITKHGWKGLLYHLATMMLVTTWLLFLSREFQLPTEAILWVLFMWGFAFLGHLVTLLSTQK